MKILGLHLLETALPLWYAIKRIIEINMPTEDEVNALRFDFNITIKALHLQRTLNASCDINAYLNFMKRIDHSHLIAVKLGTLLSEYMGSIIDSRTPVESTSDLPEILDKRNPPKVLIAYTMSGNARQMVKMNLDEGGRRQVHGHNLNWWKDYGTSVYVLSDTEVNRIAVLESRLKAVEHWQYVMGHIDPNALAVRRNRLKASAPEYATYKIEGLHKVELILHYAEQNGMSATLDYISVFRSTDWSSHVQYKIRPNSPDSARDNICQVITNLRADRLLKRIATQQTTLIESYTRFTGDPRQIVPGEWVLMRGKSLFQVANVRIKNISLWSSGRVTNYKMSDVDFVVTEAQKVRITTLGRRNRAVWDAKKETR